MLVCLELLDYQDNLDSLDSREPRVSMEFPECLELRVSLERQRDRQ